MGIRKNRKKKNKFLLRKRIDRMRPLDDNPFMGERIAFTAVFQKVGEGYIGTVEELPGANTQGATTKEARKNLKEAIHLVLEANRQIAEKEFAGKALIREKIELSL
jgi:predicted RNase H-like HicB family nuclease